MSGFKTAASKTLVALVTAGIASVLASILAAAPATAAPATTGTPASGSFAESTAQQAYAALSAALDADTRTATAQAKKTAKKTAKKAFAKAAKKNGKPLTAAARRKAVRTATRTAVTKALASVAPINDPSRIAALPVTLSAPVLDADTTLPEALLTFHIGVEATAVCLDLTTGATTAGRCGGIYEPLPQNLTYTYDSLVRTVQWFDAHADVYGQTAQSVALIDRVTETEVSAAAQVTFTDLDHDSLVDGGEVTLSVDGLCGTVVLPEHDPTGATYTARLLHETC